MPLRYTKGSNFGCIDWTKLHQVDSVRWMQVKGQSQRPCRRLLYFDSSWKQNCVRLDHSVTSSKNARPWSWEISSHSFMRIQLLMPRTSLPKKRNSQFKLGDFSQLWPHCSDCTDVSKHYLYHNTSLYNMYIAGPTYWLKFASRWHVHAYNHTKFDAYARHPHVELGSVSGASVCPRITHQHAGPRSMHIKEPHLLQR